MDVKSLYTDPTLERDGVWVNYREGSRVKIASLRKREFHSRLDALRKPYRRQIQMGTADDAMLCETMARAAAETILVDWEGFTRDGKPLPYSPQAAFELLRDAPIFADEMVGFAADQEAYRLEDRAEAEKNSEPSSTGTSERGKSGTKSSSS